MRKVTFLINYLEWMRKYYNLTDEQYNDIFKNQESFKCIFTLIGKGKIVDKYEMTDYDRNKICMDDLNGYQKGVVLNDCYAYFTGGKYHSDIKEPCGVVDIKEEEIYRIGKYSRHSDGKFHLVEEEATDSPYWEVINGIIYYVFWTGKYGVDYEESLCKVSMGEEEAIRNNCGCYYKILE